MDSRILLFLACTVVSASAWSVQRYPPRRAPMRITRFAPSPPHLQQKYHHRIPTTDVEEPQWNRPKRGHDDYNHRHDHAATGGGTGSVHSSANVEESQWNRPKRGHDDFDHYDHIPDQSHGHKATRGITGPVHTFVKTDKNANYKWGVRHHVGDKYAS